MDKTMKQARPHPYANIHTEDLRILDKHQQLVPMELNAAQDHLLKHLSGRNLVLKARQLGISTAVQAAFFMAAINSTARISTLAHDKEATQKLRDMTQLFYEELPPDKRPLRLVNTAARTHYANHSIVYFGTAGNARAGRGGTYSHVHGSEVAFWKDGRRVLAGLMQGVPLDGRIVLESTPNGAQGWFYEQVMAAHKGESDWRLHFFEWWWNPAYRIAAADDPSVSVIVPTDEEYKLMNQHRLSLEQIAWRRAKQRELGELFQQEYPEDVYSAFLKTGDRYFRLNDEMFTAHRESLYRADHRYVAGLDFGQSNDYTVCVVLDATTHEQVDLLRVRRRAWADMRHMIVEICFKWGVHTLVAESNSMGGTNIEALRAEMATAGCMTALVPFQTTHSSKNGIIAELRLALEERDLKLLPDPAQQHELESFASQQLASGIWQLSAPAGEHDDCVMALALAKHAMGTGTLILFST